VHPFLFQIGPVRVPTYGIVAVTALLIAIWLTRRYARIEGLNPSRMMDAIVLTIAVAFVSARVLEVAINWRRYFGAPGGLKLLTYATGVFVGGLVGGIVFLVIWLRRIHVPVLQGLDILALVAAISTGVGRWGCFFSGCCWGIPTSAPWAVTFPEIARRMHKGLPDVPIHPTQIYESLMSLAILGILVVLYRKKRFHGRIIAAYIVLYSVGRFMLEFVRGDEDRGFVLGTSVSTSQFACALLALAGAAGYWVLARRHRLSGEPDWRPARVAAPVRQGRKGRS
jgi:phosphatidylglycerol:prolipoprotein diacylglycerol transferase